MSQAHDPVPSDLSGTWRGHYAQEGREHDIEMKVVQTGNRIAGQMRDSDTLLYGDVTIHFDIERLPGVVGVETASALTELPEDSSIEGTVRGEHVVFEKRYRGPQRTTMWTSEGTVAIEAPEHVVSYRGKLDATRRVLKGRWRIPPPAPGLPELSDAFELRRHDTSAGAMRPPGPRS